MDHIDRKKSRRTSSKTRERIEKRRQRREALSNLANEGIDLLPDIKVKGVPKSVSSTMTVIRDGIWHFQKDLPLTLIAKAVGGFALVLAAFFFLSTIFSSKIGPNISTMEMRLSGMTVDEATEALFLYWNQEAMIDIMLNGEVFAQVSPNDIGISLDASATAQSAKDAGLAGFPFGHEVEPVITADYGEIQNYMLNIANAVYVPSYEAGYQWRDGELYSVRGNSSRELDVAMSVQRIVDNPLQVILLGSVELVTTSTPPTIVEADPYYDDALSFVTSEFIVEGYDPFTDETELWLTTRQEMASWLVVTDTGLAIREDGLDDFVEQVNSRIDLENWSRYIDPVETYDAVNTALLSDQDLAEVRIRYADSTYELQSGDWGLRLARRLGLPLINIQTSNPGLDWDTVFAGQRVALPSRDLVIPLEPIEEKRIVVDLGRRYLVAYENDEVLFHWPISIGMDQAPTHPGVFQILEKVDVAFGSSFSLCNADNECGQWEMDYFMGIYEVGVGLTNGFHGDVRLPNGAHISGGSAQLATTFGCVMSDDAQAQLLYEWADTGVIVELVDAVYPPQSDLGRHAMQFITDTYQQG